MVKKARKTRSDKGKGRPSYPKKRKKPRPYNVKAHSRGGPGPLPLGELLTDKDKDALKLGYAWRENGEKRRKK